MPRRRPGARSRHHWPESGQHPPRASKAERNAKHELRQWCTRVAENGVFTTRQAKEQQEQQEKQKKREGPDTRDPSRGPSSDSSAGCSRSRADKGPRAPPPTRTNRPRLAHHREGLTPGTIPARHVPALTSRRTRMFEWECYTPSRFPSPLERHQEASAQTVLCKDYSPSWNPFLSAPATNLPQLAEPRPGLANKVHSIGDWTRWSLRPTCFDAALGASGQSCTPSQVQFHRKIQILREVKHPYRWVSTSAFLVERAPASASSKRALTIPGRAPLLPPLARDTEDLEGDVELRVGDLKLHRVPGSHSEPPRQGKVARAPMVLPVL